MYGIIIWAKQLQSVSLRVFVLRQFFFRGFILNL